MNIFISVRKSEKVLKSFFSGFLVLALVMSQVALPFGVAYATQEEQGNKVNICHKNGNSGNWNALNVDENGWGGHSGHDGDYLYTGPLEQDGTPTDDGDGWCGNNVPGDMCPDMEGYQSNPEDCLPPPAQEAQISAAKIICPTEDLLPNWGSGGPEITAATVGDFLATHPTCYEQPGWMYEWAVDGTANPGDNVEVAGGAWIPFDENNLPEVPVGSRVWVREQIPSGYIPFSSATSDLENETSKNSAEFYCSTDVLNYDNYDFIDPVVAGLYHCVGFNVPTAPPLQCNPEVNLIENGDFEAPALSNGTWDIVEDIVLDPLSVLKWFVAWVNPLSVGRLGLEIQNNVAGAPAGGSQHAELDGDHPVTIWQDIPTIPGKEYSLSFKYSPRPGRDLADDSLQVKKDGVVLGADIASDGTANGNTVWQTILRNFVATGSTTKVEIFDNGTDTSFGGYVDDVDLRCIGDTTPKSDGFIHIYKFVDGEQATSEAVDGVSFPMFNNRDVNTYTLNPNGWWGGNDQEPADIPYEATAWQAGGGTYSTWEDLTTPLVGETCLEENGPAYALEGYSSGATLEEAIANGANKTLETPIFVIDGDLNIIVWNKKCGDEEPKTSTVTMCKVDSQENELSGWTLMLKGESVENLSVNSNNSLGTTTSNPLISGASYIAQAIGTWLNQGGANPVDAEYSTTDGWLTQMDGYTGYQTDILELQIDNKFDPLSTWGAYNSLHKYAQSFVPTGTSSNFRIFDGTGTTQDESWFADNSGSLDVSIYKGYSGITSENGCVVFSDVPYGTYNADEIMQDGWTNVSGLGEVVVDEPSETFTVVNRDNSIVPEPEDMCPNIPEIQTEVPEGMHLDNEGQCVPNVQDDLPQCSDGIDNDEDGLTDSSDPGCSSTQDDDETNSTVPPPNPGGGGGGGGAGGFVLLPQSLAPQGQVLGASTSCEPYIDSYLKMGAKNNKEQVKKLQQFLNDYLKLNPKLPINGNFGLQTYKAVVKFQEQEADYILRPWVGITLKSSKKGTGWAYKTTITHINNIMCPELNLQIPPLVID